MDAYSAIPSIYDAALSGQNWMTALDEVAAATEARGVMLFSEKKVGVPYSVQRSNSLYIGKDEEIRRYYELYEHYDRQGISAIMRMAPFAPLTDIDIWPDLLDGQERPDISYIRKQIGIFRRVIYKISPHEALSSGIILQFPTDYDVIPNEAFATASVLLPHIAKSIEINSIFSALYMKYKAILCVLDHVKVGLAVVSRDGDVIIKNEQFEYFIDGQYEVRINRNGKLYFLNQDKHSQFKDYTTKIYQTSVGRESIPELSMSVPQPGDIESVHIEISPLRDFDDELNEQFAGCLVTAIDPSTPPPVRIGPLSSHFNLTDAEAIVADALTKGFSLPAIAEQRGVAVETVRTQTKAIYMKTGANSRTELIKRVVSLSPPINV